MSEKADRRIIIVEGRAGDTRELRIQLEQLGYAVVGAALPGEKAAEAMGRLELDLVRLNVDTADQDKEQAVLQESEGKYRQVFELAPDAIYLNGVDGRFVDGNRAAEQLVGYKKEELIGKSFDEVDLFSPDEMARALANLEKIAAGRPVGPDEFTLRRKDGRKVTVEIRAFPVSIRGRKMSLGIARDITQRKSIEKRLHDSLRMSDDLVRTIPSGIYIYEFVAPDKLILIDANKAAEEQTGIRLCDWKGKEFDEIWPQARRLGLTETYLNVVRTGEPSEAEDLAYKDERLDATFRVRAFTLPNNRLAIAFENITDQKLVEEKLQRESLMRKTILDNLPCTAMILKNKTREIVACNEVARGLGAAPGKTCYTTCAGRDASCPWCLAPEVWTTGEPRRLEVEYEGTHYEGIWVPLSEDLYVHYVFDITERKRAERELIERGAQLKSLASQLSRTEERERHRLATILHDRIGQSLVFSKLKLDELRTSDCSADPAEVVDEVCDCLGRVIQETRTLTFDLSSPILYELGFEAAVAEWLTDEIKEKHGIETEFSADVRRKPLSDDIRATLFRNVRELLINVVRHARARKVKVSIRVVDNNICVGVEDDGVGFDPAEVKLMAARSDKFGLFSIRERLEQLGGLIEIDSVPGRGSRISMKAPLKCENRTDGKET
ncbi:MAG: PAS domain S-box protein [Planctomycetota bacterium]